MKYYFRLQIIRLKRLSEEIGINFYLGLLLGMIGFGLLSVFLFYKTDLASWIYVFLSLNFVFFLGERGRNYKLKRIFSKIDFLQIRWIENIVLSLPFLVFLCYKLYFLEGVVLTLVASLLSLVSTNLIPNRTIPTPFRRIPFEFIVGFRQTFPLILFSMFLLLKAIQVDNYNLGVVVLGEMFLIGMSFYFYQEPIYFVHIFHTKVKEFIKNKVLDAFLAMSYISLPIASILLFFFPKYYVPTLIVFIVGYIYLASSIVAKYSSYPKKMNLPKAFLYALSIWMPPLLLLIIPMFYKHSKRQLEPILE